MSSHVLLKIIQNYAMMDYLCEDLMFEIFSRLPPVSLLRFRSLSKSVCSLIASHEFIRKHASRSPQKVFIRHAYVPKEDEYWEDFYTIHSQDQFPLCPITRYIGITPIEFPYVNCVIVGSCNGLICLFGKEVGISLWNPSIRRKLTLPYHPSWANTSKNHYVEVGFGFEPITHDYKIVTINSPKSRYEDEKCLFLVYSMKKDAWCEISPPSASFYHVTSSPCFVNGTLHWMVECLDKLSYGKFHRCILTFDLATHVFSTIELPEPSCDFTHLTIFKGSLAIISRKGLINWIWVRECSNTTSWSLALKLEIDRPDEGIGRITELANGDFLLGIHILGKRYTEAFDVYNPKTRIQTGLVGLNDDSVEWDVEMYVDSLELLGMGSVWEGTKPYFLGGEKKSAASQELEWKAPEVAS
ncbi:F-box/kelch-repeat protein-like protein [Tanacetum coccineum]